MLIGSLPVDCSASRFASRSPPECRTTIPSENTTMNRVRSCRGHRRRGTDRLLASVSNRHRRNAGQGPARHPAAARIPDEKAQKALKGVMMELDDCAFPLLQASSHSDPTMPSRMRMSRCWWARARAVQAWSARICWKRTADLHPAGPGAVGTGEPRRKGAGGRQSGEHQCLHRMKTRRAHKASNFSAMMRLDHNRALTQIAQKVGKPVATIAR